MIPLQVAELLKHPYELLRHRPTGRHRRLVIGVSDISFQRRYTARYQPTIRWRCSEHLVENHQWSYRAPQEACFAHVLSDRCLGNVEFMPLGRIMKRLYPLMPLLLKVPLHNG